MSDVTNTTSYSYDAQGQLIRENNQPAGKTWVWTYDSGGNILSRTEYAYTTGSPGTAQSSASYTYGDTGWGDLLTAYNGQAITYDGIGNMTSYGGWSLGWSGGRRLSTMSRDGTSLLFAYNDEGQRTEKTANGSTHKYLYRGGLLIADICGNDALYFRYDQNGEVIGFLRTLGTNRAEYRYVKNQQGDVVAVIDFAGAEAATYSYDGWGNVLTTGGYDANLAARNPLRYRGYYYDSETELYYVTSRYYNPEMGRFICADGYATTYNSAAGANMFAYCLNSTILFRDDQGTRPVINSLEKETPQELAYSYAYIRTRLSISTTKTSGSWAASFGWEFGIAFGLRVSASQQIVFDSEGDFGVATMFFFGGGTLTIYAGLCQSMGVCGKMKKQIKSCVVWSIISVIEGALMWALHPTTSRWILAVNLIIHIVYAEKKWKLLFPYIQNHFPTAFEKNRAELEIKNNIFKFWHILSDEELDEFVKEEFWKIFIEFLWLLVTVALYFGILMTKTGIFR